VMLNYTWRFKLWKKSFYSYWLSIFCFLPTLQKLLRWMAKQLF
jgi:hypothetical protein